MSHFCVLVLTEDGQDVDELMLPYMENCCGQPPLEYMEFYEDDECEVDEATGKRGYWQNPNAKWDWYEMGGRFRGMLKATRGERAPLGSFDGNYKYPAGRYDRARLGDCDFAPDEEARLSAIDFWERVVEGKGNDEDRPFHLYKPEFYANRYKDKKAFAELQAAFTTWAVVTPDGKWHEPGKMGWWGLSSETDEEAVAWEQGYFKTFLADADPDLTATILDCHI